MTETVLLILATAVAIGAIFVFFIQMRVRRNTKRLVEVENKIENIHEEEQEAHKLMIQILHLAHQMKTLQTDWDDLKKRGILKSNGNGHTKHPTQN